MAVKTDKWIPPQAVTELIELLGELRVTHRLADGRTGRYWRVYAHPSPADEQDRCNILLHVSPKSPEEGLSAARTPFALRGKDGSYYISTGRTNRRGQAWFENLPAGQYGACADEVRLWELAEPALVPGLLAASGTEDRRAFFLKGQRVRAVLEREAVGGRTLVTLSAKGHDYQGARVRVTIGDETAEMTLTRAEMPTPVMQATHRFGLQFADAVQRVPEIEVLAAQGNEETV